MKKKIGLADLAKAMGVQKETPDISTIKWEEKSIQLCAKCGCRLVRSNNNANVRVCAMSKCGYVKKIRYGERQVGEFSKITKEFRQRILYFRDFFAPLEAFGLAPEIVDRLRGLGCKTILLRDRENFCSYHVDFNIFSAYCFGFKLNNGVVMQYLSIKHWKKIQGKKRIRKINK